MTRYDANGGDATAAPRGDADPHDDDGDSGGEVAGSADSGGPKAAGGPAKSSKRRHRTFVSLNALVDGGHLGSLRPFDLRVFIVYLRHANAEGVAWPSPTTIARRLGHAEPSNVRKARRRLVGRGLLRAMDVRGGRANGKYEVMEHPPDPPD